MAWINERLNMERTMPDEIAEQILRKLDAIEHEQQTIRETLARRESYDKQNAVCYAAVFGNGSPGLRSDVEGMRTMIYRVMLPILCTVIGGVSVGFGLWVLGLRG